jgi:esterase/lipase superfamily enzyme
MGGYHAANFFFRHPDIFDTMVSLSGVMDLRLFVGDYVDNNVYFNAPLRYLKNLTDEHYLKLYRQSKIIVCVGRGAWDEQMLADARALEAILKEKQVQAWIDYWGPDVSHDWPWWQKQWPYFLGRLGY